MEYVIALVVLIVIVIFVERLFWNRAMRKAKREYPLPECDEQSTDHSKLEEELRLATEELYTSLNEAEEENDG